MKPGDWWDIATQWLIAIIAILVASAFAAGLGVVLLLLVVQGVAS